MKIKSLLTFLSLLIFPLLLSAQNYNLVIGTYTNPGKSEGIYVYRFNVNTGEYTYKSKAAIHNPSFLTVSRNKNFVYAVSEAGNGNGTVSAYKFNSASGELAFLNKESSGGDDPCYISIDDNNKYVFVGNYSGGNVAAISVKDDGSLNSDLQVVQHQGNSINASRQEKPHVHASVLSPDNRYLFTPDLGTDKVNIYHVNLTNTSQPLSPVAIPFNAVQPGSGPRHITFHPNGQSAYLVQELNGMVTFYKYKEGRLKAKQSITMLSDAFKGKVGAADIHVSPDGKFLYATNRGDANELVIYSINKKGKLKFAGRQSTLGETPRNFSIDPTGNYLLVANQTTDDIIIFKRNHQTGLLTPTGKKIEVSSPVCLQFVAEN